MKELKDQELNNVSGGADAKATVEATADFCLRNGIDAKNGNAIQNGITNGLRNEFCNGITNASNALINNGFTNNMKNSFIKSGSIQEHADDKTNNWVK